MKHLSSNTLVNFIGFVSLSIARQLGDTNPRNTNQNALSS